MQKSKVSAVAYFVVVFAQALIRDYVATAACYKPIIGASTIFSARLDGNDRCLAISKKLEPDNYHSVMQTL